MQTEIKAVGKAAPTANRVSHRACLTTAMPAEGLSPQPLENLCALLQIQITRGFL